MKFLSRFAATAVALVAALTLATTAHAGDPLKCKQEIGKDFSKFVQAKAKALQKCRESIVKNQFAGPCPDAGAATKIATAESKMRAGIAKKCGGSTKSCTDGDAVALSAISWDMGQCPHGSGSDCNNLITDCNGISDCLVCHGEEAVDDVIGLSYDALAAGQFGSNSAINKCQLAIGKNAAKFIEAKNKALQKCEDGVLKGTVTGPCPDAIKALPAINKAETKKVAGICKACGGPDKLCGGGDDLTPAVIGFASTCPSVTIPGGSACGGAITTVSDIVTCVDCVNEYQADCLDAHSVPALKTLPAECNLSTLPPCAATPANTATPCPTATPGVVCPSQVVTEANGPGVDLDTGWTGQSHDGHAPSLNRLTLNVGVCSMPDSSTCGVCPTSGPVTNAGGTVYANHRCVLDTSIQCSVDGDCGVNGPCSFFFGSPLPLSAGGVSVCVTNQITAPVTGTVDVEGGTNQVTIQLLSRVHTGPTVDRPCPTCDTLRCHGGSNNAAICTTGTECPGGFCGLSCSGGPHDTNACVVNGVTGLFGPVSFDCPPSPGANVGNLPITLAYSTGTQTRTLSAANPACRAPGFSGDKCFCDTCNNAAATPCTSNADCVLAGATVCGGRRCLGGTNNGAPCAVNSECPGTLACGFPGTATKPNDCDDSTCSSVTTCVGGCNDFLNCTGAFKCVGGANDSALCTVDSECPGGSCDEQCPGGACVAGNEGTCAAGPFEQFCVIDTFRQCISNGDCPRVGDSCTLGKFRDCFTDNGGIGGSVTVTGVPYPTCGNTGTGAAGALFCVPPTSSGSVNSVSGLPGLGRIRLPYTSTYN